MKRTTKVFIVACVWAIAALNGAFAQIEFYTNNSESGFETVLRAAKRTNKLVMIDCYTDWCGWCKKYDRTSFADETVGEFANENFICYKLDMETPLGEAVAEVLSVESYPTVLWLTPEGKVVKRLEGYQDADDFLSTCRRVYTNFASAW